MASSLKFVFLFFFITTLVFSLQTHARESHFFSKVTRNREESPSTTPNTNKFFMNNQENEYEPLNKQQDHEEQPKFIPQTTEAGYGLYGHETGLNPPSTTTNSLYNMDENNNNEKNNFEDFNNYFKHNNEDQEKNYAPQLKGLSSTSYSTNVAPTKYVNNFNNNNNYNNNDVDDDDEGKYFFNGGVRRRNNNNDGMQEKQGMSDTRFLENGKYFFDIDSEKNFEPKKNNNNYMSHYNSLNDNYETNNGYFGNNKATTSNRFDAYYDAYYRNNNNKNKKMDNNNNNYNFFGGNGMQGYKNNQVPQEDEFQFDDQP